MFWVEHNGSLEKVPFLVHQYLQIFSLIVWSNASDLVSKWQHKATLFMCYLVVHYQRQKVLKPTWHLYSVLQRYSFSLHVISPSVRGFQLFDSLRLVSAGYVSMVSGTQRKCCTLSVFRPFLNSEHKRQGPKRDKELAIWHLIRPDWNRTWASADHGHRYVRTHMHLSVGGVKAGFLSYLSNKTQTPTPFLQRKKQKTLLEESVSKLYFGNYEHNFKMIAFMAPSPLHTSFRLNNVLYILIYLLKSFKLPYFKFFCVCLFVWQLSMKALKSENFTPEFNFISFGCPSLFGTEMLSASAWALFRVANLSIAL